MAIADLTEHAKQLRSIQFVIIASSFALLLSTAVTSSNLLETIIDDIKALRTVDDKKKLLGLDDYESWLLEEGRKTLAEYDGAALDFPLAFQAEIADTDASDVKKHHIFILSKEGPAWTVFTDKDWHDVDPSIANIDKWANPSQSLFLRE